MKKSNSFSVVLCVLCVSVLNILSPTHQAHAQSQPITLDLGQPTNPASFTLDANNVWTETFNDVDYPFIEFNNSAFKFTHLGAGEGDSYGGYYWDGFTYSKNADNTDPSGSGYWYGSQWGNMAGGGIKTDADGNVLKDENDIVIADPDVPYLLAYWAGYMEGYYTYPVLTTLFDDVYQADGIYVNINTWPYYGNIHGDGSARPLNQDGDYFKLFIHGLDENYVDNGKTVEHYLAQNIGGTLIQSPNWEWIDLSGLGEVAGVYFTMESTDSDPMFGMNTAAYFCIDRLQVRVPGEVIPVTGVVLNFHTLPLAKDETCPLIATVLPENATNKNVTWESSNATIATVDENGMVTAIAEGETNITVTTEDGNYTDVCIVTVTDKIAVTGVELNIHTLPLAKDETCPLIATVLPENATNKNVTWESSDETIATVDENGVVTAIAEGETNITVTTEDGNYTDVCIVTVTEDVGIEALPSTPEGGDVRVYPNPTTGELTICDMRYAICDIAIFDVMGRTVVGETLAVAPDGTHRLQISASAPAGVYFIRIHTNDGVRTVKVIKQ
ncbi:MAG: Ig-like domain-containing protein [Bacteroidales bacterium]|nr:Ig-like domain-containing protein [Bacteroidales bacterium]